jgi:hypothetical protein
MVVLAQRFRGRFVLGGCGLKFLELQLHLVQQAGGTLGARAEAGPVRSDPLQRACGGRHFRYVRAKAGMPVVSAHG